MSEWFRRFAANASNATGSVAAFLLAFLVVIAWAATGPLFGFSDTWQLIINTGTTVATFLMVFLIQNTQNRDARALHTKLDELIVATKGARNKMVTAEELPDEELAGLKQHFEKVAECRGESRDGTPQEPIEHPRSPANGRRTAHKKQPNRS